MSLLRYMVGFTIKSHRVMCCTPGHWPKRKSSAHTTWHPMCLCYIKIYRKLFSAQVSRMSRVRKKFCICTHATKFRFGPIFFWFIDWEKCICFVWHDVSYWIQEYRGLEELIILHYYLQVPSILKLEREACLLCT